jgi:hypothetical protein
MYVNECFTGAGGHRWRRNREVAGYASEQDRASMFWNLGRGSEVGSKTGMDGGCVGYWCL